MVKRVGIIGYGHLGQFLVSKILDDENFDLAFVWNRTKTVLDDAVEASFILDNLDDFFLRKPDIVVEVAHPSVTRAYGAKILEHCDYMVGSPSALSDETLFKSLELAASVNGLYVPSGALWGGEDLQKLSEAGKLRSLTVKMKKHPQSLKVIGYLKEKNEQVKTESTVLYEGCVRDICKLAPNNVNTMAAAAIAAPNLGFDGVTGILVSDPNLTSSHIVEVDAYGFPNKNGSCFHVHTVRENPAAVGAVTGEATFAAYFGSLKRAGGKGPGLHLC